MEKYAEIDRSGFPIVVIRFTGLMANNDNFRAYLEQMSSLYDEEKDLAIIFDARRATLPDLGHQRMQAQWLHEHREVLKSHCKGTAYVITKAAVRTVLRMIFALYTQPEPYKIVASMEEAEEWVQRQMGG